MRSTYLPLILLILATSCNNAGETADTTATIPDSVVVLEDGSVQTPDGKPINDNWERLTMMAYRDNQGRVIAETPYPSGWVIKSTVRQGEPSITGPNGVKIMDQPSQSYIWSNDPYFQNLYMQSGQQVRPWQGAEQLVQNDFVPALQGQGWKLLKWYEVPEVTSIDKWYNDQMYKAVPMQMQIMALGTEWEKDDGSMAFMISHISVSTTAQLQTWSYFSAVLKADKQHFETARKQYIFSMANTRYALEPIAEYNQREAQKAGQSWAAHNQRMAQNQAAFEQNQRNHVNKSNAINDAIMSGYNQRMASGNKQQEQFVDAINEKTNVVDGSGNQYKVESHYNQYWMNSNGEYISTNQNSYNPNLDDNMNGVQWQNLQKVE